MPNIAKAQIAETATRFKKPIESVLPLFSPSLCVFRKSKLGTIAARKSTSGEIVIVLPKTRGSVTPPIATTIANKEYAETFFCNDDCDAIDTPKASVIKTKL